MTTEKIKLFDTVAFLKTLPEKKVVYGQVGTVVELLKPDVFEVEFANKQGETIASFAVLAQDLMLLHYEMEFA